MAKRRGNGEGSIYRKPDGTWCALLNCADDTWDAGFGSLISSKHYDFVLADPESLTVALCIELDDRSHDRPERRERDDFLNRATKGAGVLLLRVPARQSYDPAELRLRVLKALERHQSAKA